MKSLIAAVLISTIVPQKQLPRPLPKNQLTKQDGIVLLEGPDKISVYKLFYGWGGAAYRVRTKNEQGKVLEHFVSDKPFIKTEKGWAFKLEGREETKEVSGLVEIGKL
jgi:hypothetical protein